MRWNRIKRKLDVELPSDEAGNIAFHFINAQVDHPYNDKNRDNSRVTENVLEIVQYYFKLVYEEESTSYSRYVTHVRLFAQRLVSGQLLPGGEFPASLRSDRGGLCGGICLCR